MEQEDYLETIYKLGLKNDHVRVSDLAKELKLSKPSVTQMIQRLDKEDCVKYTPYSPLKLTVKGKKIGKDIAERHAVLDEFLTIMGISKTTREKDIHGMEHCLSKTTLTKLKEVSQFLKKKKFK